MFLLLCMQYSSIGIFLLARIDLVKYLSIHFTYTNAIYILTSVGCKGIYIYRKREVGERQWCTVGFSVTGTVDCFRMDRGSVTY